MIATRRKVCAAFLCLLLLGFPGCKKATNGTSSPSQATASPASQAKVDVCALLTKAEVEAIQGSPITDTKSSAHSGGGLRVAQCYYAAADPSRSVSLALTQSDPESPAKRSAKDVWTKMLGPVSGGENQPDHDKQKEPEGAKEKKKKKNPPKKINGLGGEAYWTGTGVGGMLLVFEKEKDAFIRVSVGGPDTEETKLNKSKALAEKALQRL